MLELARHAPDTPYPKLWEKVIPGRVLARNAALSKNKTPAIPIINTQSLIIYIIFGSTGDLFSLTYMNQVKICLTHISEEITPL